MFTFKCFFVKNVSLSFKSKAWQSLWLGFEDIIERISKMGFGNETRIRHVRVGFQDTSPASSVTAILVPSQTRSQLSDPLHLS